MRKYSCNNELSLHVKSNGPCGKYPHNLPLQRIGCLKPTASTKPAHEIKISCICLEYVDTELEITERTVFSIVSACRNFFLPDSFGLFLDSFLSYYFILILSALMISLFTLSSTYWPS